MDMNAMNGSDVPLRHPKHPRYVYGSVETLGFPIVEALRTHLQCSESDAKGVWDYWRDQAEAKFKKEIRQFPHPSCESSHRVVRSGGLARKGPAAPPCVVPPPGDYLPFGRILEVFSWQESLRPKPGEAKSRKRKAEHSANSSSSKRVRTEAAGLRPSIAPEDIAEAADSEETQPVGTDSIAEPAEPVEQSVERSAATDQIAIEKPRELSDPVVALAPSAAPMEISDMPPAETPIVEVPNAAPALEIDLGEMLSRLRQLNGCSQEETVAGKSKEEIKDVEMEVAEPVPQTPFPCTPFPCTLEPPLSIRLEIKVKESREEKTEGELIRTRVELMRTREVIRRTQIIIQQMLVRPLPPVHKGFVYSPTPAVYELFKGCRMQCPLVASLGIPDDLIGVRRVAARDPRTELIGQNTAFITRDIKGVGKTIGFYGGLLATEAESESIGDTFGPEQALEHQRYSFGLLVTLPYGRGKHQLIIGATGEYCTGNTRYINDYRVKPFSDRCVEDESKINCEFKVVERPGQIPHVLIVTTKEVYKGDELYISYGDNYFKEIAANEKRFNAVSKLITSVSGSLSAAGKFLAF